MPSFELQIDKIRDYFDKHKAELYPIENVVLCEKEEYIKSLYFRMLCALIRYTGEPNDMQILYVNRLISGVNAEEEFQEYMRRALELDVIDVDEFITLLHEDKLKYYFCIDGIILLSAKKEEKTYDFLAEIIEMFGITGKELGYLATMAKAILLQKSALVDDAKALAPTELQSISMYHYIKGFYVGAIVDTYEEIHIFSCDKSEVDMTQYSILDKPKVIIENVSISLSKNIIFSLCEEVIIRNCQFVGNEYFLKFTGVGKVIIENCCFNNFSNRVSQVTNATDLLVRNNKFVNCGMRHDREDIKGGVFYCEGMKFNNIILDGNELLDCYVEASKNYYRACTGIFLYQDHSCGNIQSLEVKGNCFRRCECRNNNYYNEAYISVRSYNRRIEEKNICIGDITNIFE